MVCCAGTDLKLVNTPKKKLTENKVDAFDVFDVFIDLKAGSGEDTSWAKTISRVKKKKAQTSGS